MREKRKAGKKIRCSGFKIFKIFRFGVIITTHNLPHGKKLKVNKVLK